MRLAPPLLLAWSVNAAVAPPPSEEAAAAGPLKFGRIALRDATVGPVPRAECLDSASADNESPLKTSQCSQNKTTQLFSYDPKHHFLVLQTTVSTTHAPNTSRFPGASLMVIAYLISRRTASAALPAAWRTGRVNAPCSAARTCRTLRPGSTATPRGIRRGNLHHTLAEMVPSDFVCGRRHISNGGQCMTASGSGGGVKVRV